MNAIWTQNVPVEPSLTKHNDPVPQAMRSATSAFPTGVVLLAAKVDGLPVGMLANSFTSVSLDPPLVSLNIARTSRTWPVLSKAEHWGISVLAEEQETVFRQLAGKAGERFAGLDWTAEADGSLVLGGASATFIVGPAAQFDAGDHILVLMHVLGLQRSPERRPLVFHGSQTARLAMPDTASPILNRVLS
ncbi:flavin reductase family protein [Limoniibacter endophyticus]|uniref:Oxidoreductase n=1 Tax=Limoniibacter endophyticus TaxID=1565040 RepID=A0A8J3DMH7_9HYPH|nr:flavin reductase family protein [Limoniibacter endophyticus]GHC70806.1 oxidoreductase [Limoniibacter endophyticus]